MSVRLDGDLIRLEGPCRVEDAEPLTACLQEDRTRRVDLGGCEHLHGAVLQALLAFSPELTGAPDDDFLRRLLGSAWKVRGLGRQED